MPERVEVRPGVTWLCLAMTVFPADSSSVSLGKSLVIFEPQFPHL